MSWYSTGFNSEKVAEDTKSKENRYGPRRFWLAPEKKGQVVFLDDQPCMFHEFAFLKNDSWQNWVTSPGSDAKVYTELVAQLGEPQLIGLLTMVSCTAWTSEADGKTHCFELQVFPIKGETVRNKLQNKTTGSRKIVNMMCEVFRASDKTVNTGDDFTFDREIDPDKMFEKVNYKGKLLSDLYDEAEKDAEKMAALKRTFNVIVGPEGKLIRRTPTFNYHEIYKPLEDDEIRKRIAGHTTPKDRKARKGADKAGDKAGEQTKALKVDEIPF